MSSALLEASWSRPGGVWGHLGRSWRRLGCALRRLGNVQEDLGGALGAPEGVLTTSWNRFWASWALLEAS